jgi:hypothetical protein
MSVITKVVDYDLFGFHDLINPPNSLEPEKLRGFAAKLFFLDIQDGTQDTIIPMLLKGHTPPRTSVLPYESDGLYCVVVYEGCDRGERTPSHIPVLLNQANDYCAKNPRERRVFSAQEFLQEFPQPFRNIVKSTLGMDLLLR